MDITRALLLLLALSLGLGGTAWADEGPSVSASDGRDAEAGPVKGADFAGPASTQGLLAEEDVALLRRSRLEAFDRVFCGWNAWKGRVAERLGLRFGGGYTALYQHASHALPGQARDAGAGIFQLFARWELVNRGCKNSGTLVASMEHRHGYTGLVPQDLGFAAGYLGIPGLKFTDEGLLLGDLNWQQRFNDGRTGLIVGRYDPNDFFDMLGYANPWTAFQNLAVLLNATISLPGWSTGVGIGHWFDDRWYAIASVNDAKFVNTEPTFFEDFGELYKTAELGWTSERDERFLRNVHVTAWHADERENDGVEESWGLTCGGNWTWKDRWMVFGRVGWSEGSAPLYDRAATVGFLRYLPCRADLIGVGVNWGRPSDDTLNDQWTVEAFYRYQVSQNLALTPSLQWLGNPALRADDENLWIAGLRVRLTF